jgi:hypothetical protein
MMSLSIVLRIRRKMTGEEVDPAIATVLAGQAAAVERIRRAQWRQRVENATKFQIGMTGTGEMPGRMQV